MIMGDKKFIFSAWWRKIRYKPYIVFHLYKPYIALPLRLVGHYRLFFYLGGSGSAVYCNRMVDENLLGQNYLLSHCKKQQVYEVFELQVLQALLVEIL